MIRAALCGGEGERKQLRAMLERHRLSVEVTEYEAVDVLLWDMETENVRYDLYLLPSGKETAGRLLAMDADALLIFLTEEAAGGEGHTVGCLGKPVEEKALDALLEKTAERLRQYKRQVVVITQRGRTQVLRFNDIEYISSVNHTVRFHLHGGEERICYSQLDKVSDQLSRELFVRCHQSHIVNLSYVTGHTAKAFRMTSTVVPISRSYALQARKALEEYLYLTPSSPPEET